MIFISHSLEETFEFASNWLSSLEEPKDEALLVGLYGNLGSGKTAFTQVLAKELGVEDFVTSPTFVIEKIYKTNHPFIKRLIHIDAYRLSSGKELLTLGLEEVLENKNNIVVIEWPENIKEVLPENHKRIYCEFVNETTRKFEVQ